jgi:hypothetical protein
MGVLIYQSLFVLDVYICLSKWSFVIGMLCGPDANEYWLPVTMVR